MLHVLKWMLLVLNRMLGVLNRMKKGVERINTSEQEVLKLLNALGQSKSTSPDRITVKLLKMIALIIAKALAILLVFNPRPVRAFLITRAVRGEGEWYDPPGDRPLMVVELRRKDQSMRLDELSRLHILFLVLG